MSVDGRSAPIRMHSAFGVNSNSAAVYGEVRDGSLVRIHSRCMYSEVFASRECDCGWQLRRSRQLLTLEGGVLIYLDQEGRAAGLRAKAEAYRLNHEAGLDTYQAYEQLGYPSDSRDYTDAVHVLQDLRLAWVRLLTNNPGKIAALEDAGIKVEHVSLRAEPTPTTVAYLEAKKRHGHLLLRLKPVPTGSPEVTGASPQCITQRNEVCARLTSPGSCRTIVVIGTFSRQLSATGPGQRLAGGAPCLTPQPPPDGETTCNDSSQAAARATMPP
jgi:3,4-dihydroxy 2-butanone 4-phosphate synthase/GTP cyclohydrolase II